MRSRILNAVATVVIATLAFVSSSHATTHPIHFGGSVGFAYDSNSIVVNVGDTIEWIGSFSFHPLVADEFPNGATKFTTVSSGSDFLYVVSVPGTYSYHCQIHGTSSGTGMAGTFSTGTAGVSKSSPLSTQIVDIMPNPSNKLTMIDFELANAGTVKITIASMDGKVLATPLNTYMEAGAQMIDYDCAKLAAGSYLVTLESGGVTVSKRVVVEK